MLPDTQRQLEQEIERAEQDERRALRQRRKRNRRALALYLLLLIIPGLLTVLLLKPIQWSCWAGNDRVDCIKASR